MKKDKILIILVVVITTIFSTIMSACASSPSSTTATATATGSPKPAASPSPSVSASPSASAAGAVNINLTAQNTAFDKSTITVPSGSQITVNFNNTDNGVPHTFSVYTDSSAATVIFKGNPITGPATTAYKFTAPTKPGTYFFRCDIHPTQMTGQFIVQ